MPNFTRKALAVMLVSSFALGSIKPAQSNPAALAPALCATGVGCVLLGTVAIAGGVYYVWEFQGGKRVAADAAGRIMRMLDDPEEGSGEIWEDPLDTRDAVKGDKICAQRARQLGASYTVVRHPATKKIICVFTGGTTR